MKRSTRAMPVAALLLAATNAQTTTVVNDPADTDATTVFYSVCPTALTTTTTLSSTITFTCPGGQCPGGPVITAPPNPNGPRTTEILAFTTTLPDGSVQEIHEYITIYPAICSGGSSIGQATYTITEACPCEATRNPASIPAGFTTTVTSCDVCHQGGPTTMTMTVPCTTGPYATVTPEIGPTGAAGASANAYAEAAASAGANAGAGGSGSSGSGSSGSGSSGSGAQAAAGAGANAAANAQAGSTDTTGAAGADSASSGNSAAGANSAGNGSSNATANAGANAATNAAAGAGANSGNRYDNGTTSGNNTISPPITPVAPGGAAQSQFRGSADKVGFAVSGVLAVVVGCLAFML
ncbi:hypothetical protein G647_10126 [Cladophialophora carrionii CBS 160.54]|uniref:Uncharacterized protein n=1 Tax=Cladophialophora carrionii CBS 160.54 TaxID=1279043 RepID=V9DM42_9EURO|nr:uncharacterized protein G647_10126 [Cladophialophora carrionii CBS 160.54]ETI27027.1 hypothetical protein G647_10126 [Cladophialophora carrionii CBS 160.54]